MRSDSYGGSLKGVRRLDKGLDPMPRPRGSSQWRTPFPRNKTQTTHEAPSASRLSRQLAAGVGGADGDRTRDLVNAISLVSGLSYDLVASLTRAHRKGSTMEALSPPACAPKGRSLRRHAASISTEPSPRVGTGWKAGAVQTRLSAPPRPRRTRSSTPPAPVRCACPNMALPPSVAFPRHRPAFLRPD
jgi:hypothetical protein